MDFGEPQDYVDALKRLEGFPLMGMEVRDGHLFFTSLSSHVALPLRRAEADGLTGVFVNWLAMDSPVDHVIDKGDCVYISTEKGGAVELLFKDEDSDD